MSSGSAIVILGAGAGSRVGADQNKVLLQLDGIPLLAYSVRTALDVEDVHRILVVVRPQDRDQVAAALAPHLGTHDLWLVDGGAERHDSELRALEALRPDIESGEIAVVAIHDGARPLAGAALFRTAIDVATAHGAAVPALPITGLTDLDGAAAGSDLVGVQTPQAFRAPELLAAYSQASADGFVGTDTAACLERYTTVEIRAIAGEATNVKVTFPEDVALATELVTSANG
ncbi:MAG: 2-C-methyl-D-erythritol 4-phosphate cytidylyltransferase [Marmoricola sp.]